MHISDYNGKTIGYDFATGKLGCSLEVITQWRSMKTTVTKVGSLITLAAYWDSGRDLSKKFVGTSQWEVTGVNSYKWTSTFAHPALVKVRRWQPVTTDVIVAHHNTVITLLFDVFIPLHLF